MSDDNSEEKKWKYKYLETIEQLEKKERSWTLTDESLRRGLSRLALVSTGLDKGLDVQLKKLRRALHDQVASEYLDEIVEKVSDYLKTMDELGKSGAADSSESSTNTPLSLLSELVESIEFPSSCQPHAKRLQRALKSRDAPQHMDRMVSEFTSLVLSAFYQGEGAAPQAGMVQPKQKSSWWKRMFGGGDNKPRVVAAELEGHAAAAEESLPKQPVRVELAGSPGAAAQVDNKQLEYAFLNFLEHLSFPTQFSERVQSLRDQLVAGLSADGVAVMVKGMVALVTDTQQQLEREKEELEIFLKQLGQRLLELDAMVEGAESNRLASLMGNRKLNDMVRAQVSDIEQTVQTATDVSQMKGAIQGSLENIRQHLAENREQEELRQAELEGQLKNLNQRLVLMEGESERLRARLAEERVQAMTDPLTNVPNRLGYEKRVAQEFSRWQRYDSPLSLLVCDIDFFKRINDTYGHKAGDRALIAIAKSIDLHIRETDYLARVGGEEFVVLLPETGLEEAKVVAEKLRKGVEACAFVYDGKPVPITISGGVAEFDKGDKVDDVYVRADKALYRAKDQGRNRFLTQK